MEWLHRALKLIKEISSLISIAGKLSKFRGGFFRRGCTEKGFGFSHGKAVRKYCSCVFTQMRKQFLGMKNT